MNRFLPRPSSRGALLALCLLVLTGCGPGGDPSGFDLAPTAGPTASPTVSAGPSPEAATCFDVATVYTALTLVPLSTGERDPGFDPDETATSLRELAPRMPEELRPALAHAAAELRIAGESMQPGELAALRQELAPVDDWLQQHCAEPSPTTG